MLSRIPNRGRVVGAAAIPHRCGSLLLILLALIWGEGALSADGTNEDQLKAAYLYNFAKFVEWPPNRFEGDTSPIRFGIIGDERFLGVLDGIVDGRSVGGREIELSSYRSVSQAEDCHLLFLGAARSDERDELLDFFKGAAVLTVGETDGFTERGGMVKFYLEGNKVRFEINEDAARGEGVKISSRLLKLARIVSTKDD